MFAEKDARRAAGSLHVVWYGVTGLGIGGKGNCMFRSIFAVATIAAGLLVWLAVPVKAQPRQVKVGTLTCSLSASIGLIIGSQKNVNCIFKGNPGEPDENYTGTMTTIGLDIGVTTGGVIIWTVFADTDRYFGMLTGTYAGATAEVSVAAGLGANVLVGGSRRAVALQPLSVQGQLGLDIAGGIGALQLHPLR